MEWFTGDCSRSSSSMSVLGFVRESAEREEDKVVSSHSLPGCDGGVSRVV